MERTTTNHQEVEGRPRGNNNYTTFAFEVKPQSGNVVVSVGAFEGSAGIFMFLIVSVSL